MGANGTFTVNVATTFSFGNLVLELPAGEYEPKDAEELAALLHLCSVSHTPEGGESVTYATQTAPADPPAVIPAESPAPAEPTLPEPPAAPEAPQAEAPVEETPPAPAEPQA